MRPRARICTVSGKKLETLRFLLVASTLIVVVGAVMSENARHRARIVYSSRRIFRRRHH